MQILVLGSAAGGGFPQWNCNCANCAGVREGAIRAKPRTQSSIAASSDSANWAIINASPDILAQIAASPRLQRRLKPRDTGIRAVILVDSQIDHTIGLAMLREGERLDIWCTASVRDDLTVGNPLLPMLESYCGVSWSEVPIEPGVTFSIPTIQGLEFTAIAVQSKAPPYSAHRAAPQKGDNIALLITDARTGKRCFYAPGLAAIEPAVWEGMSNADCVLVDGTFWTDDEMIRSGVGRKRGLEMGHLAQSGPNGMISYLRRLPRTRRVLIHINNTNPILNEDSYQRLELDSMRIEVAFDGMEITL